MPNIDDNICQHGNRIYNCADCRKRESSINNTDDEPIEYQAADIIPWERWIFNDNGKLIGLKRSQTVTLTEANVAYE